MAYAEIYGNPRSCIFASAAEVFAICIVQVGETRKSAAGCRAQQAIAAGGRLRPGQAYHIARGGNPRRLYMH